MINDGYPYYPSKFSETDCFIQGTISALFILKQNWNTFILYTSY